MAILAADNVESLDEKDLNDVSGAAAGWTLSKWCTDPQKAEYVYHRGVLVKKDAPTDGSKEWRTICTYECRDCGRIMNVAFEYTDKDHVQAKLLEAPDGGYLYRGSW